ncbi:MAG: hypothetical protein KKD28_13985 [Chloroflexi bacterium]|nr:hypothetical protein [Chloroflexota bacterium]MBU1662572.1 hypothetical protein [Chloroflexota bacterium]
MNIVKNERTIKRNSRIGQIVTIAALAILGGGMYITFTKPEMINISITALLAGFLLSQIGIYFTNRWGRKPRPDDLLDQALKGLDKNYTIYHYHTPASHVLVGPAGVWTLIPKHQRGTVTYSKNRWRQKGGGVFLAYLKIFAQEGIGRPDLELESEVDALKRYLAKKLPDLELPPIQAALVFTHPEADIQVDEAPAPTLPMKKLKDFIRKSAKGKPISSETVQAIQDVLGS